MTSLLDDPQTQALRQFSLRLKAASDVEMPQLRFWNYGPCQAHIDSGPQIDCTYRACGGDFFQHQRVGIAWLYYVKKGILADVPGAGKTNVILGLLALLKEKHELTGRAVIVCQTPAVLQWLAEAARWVPKLQVEAVFSGLTKPQRIQKYVTNWDALIIGYHLMLKDTRMLEKLEPDVVIVDDVDPLLHHENATHRAISDLCARTSRTIVINATTVQTRLQQLHAASVPVGGHDIFGSLPSFERRYVRQEPVTIFDAKSGRRFTQHKITGYKNMRELREKLAPVFLRRGYDQLTDIRMPEIMPAENVWLELHPAQRAKYKELQKEILILLKEEGAQVKHVTARAKFMYGQMICAGLPALGEPDGPEASVKLDWLMQKLDSAWADTKIITFIRNIDLVKAYQARLDQAGIGYATIWGLDRDARRRQAEQDRFWQDPNCRVFMGTSAIERSLNLQVANVVVAVDTPLNPARVGQIVGRARRAASRHSHMFLFNLFCRETQEEGYLKILQAREAVAAAVYGEKQQLYEALSTMELLQLIKP